MSRRDDKYPDNGFEAWGGYMRAKIAKLEEQFSTVVAKGETQLSNIFHGISISVNGYTIPTANELKELMARHGGIYHTYQRTEDFIIASNLPDTKIKNMSLSRVVKPDWITESLKANRLLDYKDYLLYRDSKTQPRLNFQKTGNKDEKQILKQEILEDNYKPDSSPNDDCNNRRLQSNILPTKIKRYDVTPALGSIEDSNSLIKNEKPIKNANDANFISEFYNNSRLHHISQLGAYFKQHVNELRENSDFVFLSREELKKTVNQINIVSGKKIFQNNKTIMHIDMDCFFVSVGLRTRPELKGKPVAVTHSKGGQGRLKRPGVDRETEFNMYKQRLSKKLSKVSDIEDENIDYESKIDNISDENDKYGSMSEIASCSYEARAKGISNGMFMGSALKLCPNLQTIPYDFEAYKEVALALYTTIAQYTLDIEAVSCDEMYVDCTELLASLNINAEEFASALRMEIKNKTGCPCSTGFGGNRLQARLATKTAKPNGQFFLTADLVEEYMLNVKLRDLPGVGIQTSHKLESLGHQTCGSLQSQSLATLQQYFGNKNGAQLFDQCRGLDPTPLSFYNIRKSVSAEVNYGIRFDSYEQCENFLRQLSEEVHSRLKQFKVLGKCITLKLMVRAKNAPVETAKFLGHGFCNVINKSSSLPAATNDLQIITKEVLSICKKQNIDPKEMRGIGIQITKLENLTNKKTKDSLGKFLNFVKSEDITSRVKNGRVQSNSTETFTEIKNLPTPPKVKTRLSPLKKSPILGQRSPGRKKRGKAIKTKTPTLSSKNLMSKFLQGSSVCNIKSEIVHKSVVQEKSEVKDKKLDNISKCHGLLPLPWQKVRELLRAWLESGQSPKKCDVNLIVDYMQEMVISKQLETLNILVNFLRRRVHEIDNPVWYDVENRVIDEVQNAMLAVYGKKLYIPST